MLHTQLFMDLTYNLNTADYIELQKLGQTTITLNFNQAVPVNGLQLVIYGELDSIIALDYRRNITSLVPV